MAADEERPRKTTDRGVKKLLPGEEVEILYSEEGLKGSWHLGMIYECGEYSRIVELSHLLNEDRHSKLLNTIPVTAEIEGLKKYMSKLHRNYIRPLPPKHKMKETEVLYGLCVDALVDDAWWEGVVFDHNVTSSKRLVFFPDQGDQQVISFENMRITQEWNEASGQWKPRGSWKFLQVIGEAEVAGPLPVSIREIWYDLRSLESFLREIGVWISGSKCIWHELVSELVEELQSVVSGLPVKLPITCDELCENPINSNVIQLKYDSFPTDNGGINFGFESLNPNGQSLYYNTPSCGNTVSMCLFLDGMQDSTKEDCRTQAAFLSGGHEPHLPSPHTEEQCDYGLISTFFNGVNCESNGKVLDGCDKLAQHPSWGSVSNNFISPNSASGITYSGNWQVMDFGAENCAEAIPLYLQNLKHGDEESKKEKSFNKRLDLLRLKVKRHLISFGWNILTRRENGKLRIRFVSPNGRSYNSLRSACVGLLRVKPKMIEKKKRGKLKSLDGFHFVSYYKTGSMNIGNESANGIYDRDPNELENGGTKPRSCSLPSKLTSNLVQNNIVFNEKSSCDIIDEIETKKNDCSSEKQDLVLIDCKEFPMQKDIEPEHCPAALAHFISYKNFRSKSAKKQSSMISKPNKSKVRKHLLSMGWRLWRTKHVYYYVSPSGDTFHSLFSACKACLDDDNNGVGTSRPVINEKIRRRLEYLSKETKPVNIGKKHWRRVCRCATTMADENLSEDLKVLHNGAEKKCTDSSKSSESTACNFSHIPESRRSKKRKITSSSCVHTDQKLLKHSGSCSSACAKSERRKPLPNVIEKRRFLTNSSNVRRSSKRSREVDALSPSQHVSRTVLSLLVENDVVLPRQKVKYLGKKDGRVMKEGRITRDGIKCKCCSKVFSISDFEVHASGTLRRPAANIFLKDGRSLLQCQIQMLSAKVFEGFKRSRMKRDNSNYHSDSICSVCHDGGSLILCDQCPASFHLDCVGLKEVPDDNWFCPYCCCHSCGTSEFNPDTEKFTDKTVLYCDQCEHEYHVGCMRQRGWKNLQSCPQGNWFCSGTCAKIFCDLQKLLGKSKPASLEGLSCTILRSGRDYKAGCDNIEVQAEHHSKLRVSLKVLHECFVAIIEPRTQSDLVADILFNKESELKRLNFYGFYAMLLEKGDELISVATFRIYGDKLAEMPLIGTRIKYRRQGMCRLLVREIEKLLVSIGVERFILPAVPQLLETWTTSFGFTEMSGADRLKYVDYTILNFQDTTMCQKILKVTPVAPVADPKSKGNIGNMNTDSGDQASRLVLALPCFVTPLAPAAERSGR